MGAGVGTTGGTDGRTTDDGRTDPEKGGAEEGPDRRREDGRRPRTRPEDGVTWTWEGKKGLRVRTERCGSEGLGVGEEWCAQGN